jgi:DNA-directed RNA polymerase specialized sigma24 family protein
MEAVAKALQDARDFHAKPAWYRWLHTISTELANF